MAPSRPAWYRDPTARRYPDRAAGAGTGAGGGSGGGGSASQGADVEVEVALPKGDVTEGVVRVGDTVRRPHQPQSSAVAGYLDHLASAGFAASPRYLGRD